MSAFARATLFVMLSIGCAVETQFDTDISRRDAADVTTTGDTTNERAAIDSPVGTDAQDAQADGAPLDVRVDSAGDGTGGLDAIDATSDALDGARDSADVRSDVVSCTDGGAQCDGACVDLATSASHCGACGNRCVAGATCAAGTCRAVATGGETCSSPIVIPAVTATYPGSLVGRTDDVSGCGGPDVVYQITIPPGTASLDVCVRSTTFSPIMRPTMPCGTTACPTCCITDGVDGPCDGSACSRWGSPPGGAIVHYIVESTCTDTCACPGGSMVGDYTLTVTVR